jgi:hypothetical protein
LCQAVSKGTGSDYLFLGTTHLGGSDEAHCLGDFPGIFDRLNAIANEF